MLLLLIDNVISSFDKYLHGTVPPYPANNCVPYTTVGAQMTYIFSPLTVA